jgi:hypothetical protein
MAIAAAAGHAYASTQATENDELELALGAASRSRPPCRCTAAAWRSLHQLTGEGAILLPIQVPSAGSVREFLPTMVE